MSERPIVNIECAPLKNATIAAGAHVSINNVFAGVTLGNVPAEFADLLPQPKLYGPDNPPPESVKLSGRRDVCHVKMHTMEDLTPRKVFVIPPSISIGVHFMPLGDGKVVIFCNVEAEVQEGCSLFWDNHSLVPSKGELFYDGKRVNLACLTRKDKTIDWKNFLTILPPYVPKVEKLIAGRDCVDIHTYLLGMAKLTNAIDSWNVKDKLVVAETQVFAVGDGSITLNDVPIDWYSALDGKGEMDYQEFLSKVQK